MTTVQYTKNQKHNKPSSKVVTAKEPFVQVFPMELIEHTVNLYVVNGSRNENDAYGCVYIQAPFLFGEVVQLYGFSFSVI